MPNTREKLIELLCEVIETDGCSGHCNFPPCYLVKACADNLIASGVTFATDNNVGDKWIPVTERLPEKSDYYLAFTDTDVVGVLPFSVQYGLFNAYDGNGKEHYIDVTHWMPLPQPPKGE